MPVFRTSDGAVLTYDERGSGEPAALFVHGWQGDRTVWRGVTDALPARHRLISLDLRGFGESNRAIGPYCIERFAADLQELVEGLGIAPVVVVGHSMGGTVALRFAVDAPELLRRLVLIAPVPASGGGFSAKGEAYLRATAGDPIAVRAWLARTVMRPPNDETLDFLCAAAAKTPAHVALESFESWAHADFAEATKSIAAPVLVIAPEHDAPDVHERNVAALLPNGRYALLSGAAHYANVEQPREVARLIRDS